MSYQIKVRVIAARDLPAADFNGYSDPFAELQVGHEYNWIPRVEKTRVIKRTLNPMWNEAFTMTVRNPDKDKLRIIVKDWDRFTSNDPLGETEILLCKLPMGVETVQWYPLVRKGKYRGEIQVGVMPIGFGVPPATTTTTTTIYTPAPQPTVPGGVAVLPPTTAQPVAVTTTTTQQPGYSVAQPNYPPPYPPQYPQPYPQPYPPQYPQPYPQPYPPTQPPNPGYPQPYPPPAQSYPPRYA